MAVQAKDTLIYCSKSEFFKLWGVPPWRERSEAGAAICVKIPTPSLNHESVKVSQRHALKTSVLNERFILYEPTFGVFGVTSSTAGTLALTWLFHWCLYSHWGHCWLMISTPQLTFSIWSLEPHDGHLRRNNSSRQLSFTWYFPVICRSAVLKKQKNNQNEVMWATWVECWKMLRKFNLLFLVEISILNVLLILVISRGVSIWNMRWTQHLTLDLLGNRQDKVCKSHVKNHCVQFLTI